MHLISNKVQRLSSDQHKANIVMACKVLVDQRLDSGPFGNVSVRVPDTDEFYVNPMGLTFNEIETDNILLMSLQGEVLEGRGEPHPGEFIHREIYRLRKDVKAIVHTHSDNTVALSLLGCEIEPFTQLGASIYADQGVYTDFTGPVRTSDEGVAIAKSLGDKSLVIAKNHGLFAVGNTLAAALWDFIVADQAAKIHLTALQLGLDKADKMSEAYLQKSKREVREKQHVSMWNSYLNKLKL